MKFRKCETPILEPARAKVSPFPEGRDLGWGGVTYPKKCVGLDAFELETNLKFTLAFRKCDNLRNLRF